MTHGHGWDTLMVSPKVIPYHDNKHVVMDNDTDHETIGNLHLC